MISVESKDHVLRIGVRRAEKRNALSRAMYTDLGRAMYQLHHDPNLRVGLIWAEGAHFTAGVDLNEWADVFQTGQPLAPGAAELDAFGLVGTRVQKPLVIAVQGYCYTWGVELLLACDVCLAASDTRFAMLEVKRGFFASGGATLRLPAAMGWARAQRYLLTGDEWFAPEAWQSGLVSEITEPGKQLERAEQLALAIANAAPLGVQASLHSSRLAQAQGVAAAHSMIFPELAKIMTSADAAEGVASFKERRVARFTGY